VTSLSRGVYSTLALKGLKLRKKTFPTINTINGVKFEVAVSITILPIKSKNFYLFDHLPMFED